MTALAASLAPLLQAGDVLLLEGDLGAGKSVLARGIIQALHPAVVEVPSPTFTLVQSYVASDGEKSEAPSVWHYDLYRLENPHEMIELGFEEAEQGITLVEWPSRAGGLAEEYFGKEALTVRITQPEEAASAEMRNVHFTSPSEKWRKKLAGVASLAH